MQRFPGFLSLPRRVFFGFERKRRAPPGAARLFLLEPVFMTGRDGRFSSCSLVSKPGLPPGGPAPGFFPYSLATSSAIITTKPGLPSRANMFFL